MADTQTYDGDLAATHVQKRLARGISSYSVCSSTSVGSDASTLQLGSSTVDTLSQSSLTGPAAVESESQAAQDAAAQGSGFRNSILVFPVSSTEDVDEYAGDSCEDPQTGLLIPLKRGFAEDAAAPCEKEIDTQQAVEEPMAVSPAAPTEEKVAEPAPFSVLDYKGQPPRQEQFCVSGEDKAQEEAKATAKAKSKAKAGPAPAQPAEPEPTEEEDKTNDAKQKGRARAKPAVKAKLTVAPTGEPEPADEDDKKRKALSAGSEDGNAEGGPGQSRKKIKPAGASKPAAAAKQKAFARRWRPDGQKSALVWDAIRDVFDECLRASYRTPGKMEDLWWKKARPEILAKGDIDLTKDAHHAAAKQCLDAFLQQYPADI
ncbi:unnamed protein product [Symbiodinium natans]|uniref:Uncharacterized protein n=1 Tax=Symbiodinium natans TaxID=878477 RepID=A0A812P4G9_9DINO|nr:unnamed protein product [Symbiodinium natans]